MVRQPYGPKLLGSHDLGFSLINTPNDVGISQSWGYHCGGPHNKDYSYIGVSLFRETTIYYTNMKYMMYMKEYLLVRGESGA